MAATRNTTPPNEERPLSARSVVASTLLGMRPPRLPTLILVRSGALFGIAEGTTRVAISRMVAAGELEPDGDGYRLAGALRARQARQDLSRSGPSEPWDGRWSLHVVAADTRDAQQRSDLRSAAAALRLAELREGVWTRPANLPTGLLPDEEAVVAEQCRTFTAAPAEDPAALTAELWDLAAWADRAEDLRRRLAGIIGALEAGDLGALPDGFVLSAAALRHFQADPLLPVELLPKAWPGPALRADYEAYDAAFTAVWRSWYREQRAATPGVGRTAHP
jgi:phenylacetic acid degradation operon negative regulatory protein